MMGGQIKGSCELVYFGCDTSTINKDYLPKPTTTTPKPKKPSNSTNENAEKYKKKEKSEV